MILEQKLLQPHTTARVSFFSDAQKHQTHIYSLKILSKIWASFRENLQVRKQLKRWKISMEAIIFRSFRYLHFCKEVQKKFQHYHRI